MTAEEINALGIIRNDLLGKLPSGEFEGDVKYLIHDVKWSINEIDNLISKYSQPSESKDREEGKERLRTMLAERVIVYGRNLSEQQIKLITETVSEWLHDPK